MTAMAILLVGLTLAFFTAASLIAARLVVTRWQPTLANSERLLKNRKYDEALALAEKLEARGHNAPRVQVLQGKVWLARAWKRLEKENWASYGKNDNDWFPGPDVDRAEDHFKKALEMNPDNIPAHYYLGIIYMEKGWYSSAESEFLAVLNQDEEQILARVNLATLYTKQQQYERAEIELRRAYVIEPRSVSVAKNMALLFRYHIAQPESAIVWANRYLNLDPEGDLDESFVRSELLQMLQRYPDVPLDEGKKWKNKKRFKSRE